MPLPGARKEFNESLTHCTHQLGGEPSLIQELKPVRNIITKKTISQTRHSFIDQWSAKRAKKCWELHKLQSSHAESCRSKRSDTHGEGTSAIDPARAMDRLIQLVEMMYRNDSKIASYEYVWHQMTPENVQRTTCWAHCDPPFTLSSTVEFKHSASATHF